MLLGNLLKSTSRNYRKIYVKGIAFDSRKVKKKDENWNFKNFVIVTAESNFPFKFTINDSPENVKEFVKALLDEGVPLYNGYEQDKMYKLIKMLKLG